MKTLMFSILVAACAMSVSSQELSDLYKKGTIRLIPDEEYAAGTNWDEVFRTYYDTLYGRPMGTRKSLRIMPDGSVVVNHAYRNYYTKFSPDGEFEKEFGIINSSGRKFERINSIEGIINNNTFFTGLDNAGNMIFFDFNGNYVKTLKLDYMARQMIPLPNNKIAVVGRVIWQTQFRDFAAIVDYETNDQEIIWDHFTERYDITKQNHSLFHYSYTFKEGGGFGITTMPFAKSTGISSPLQIASIENNLIIAVPTTGEILVYDFEGNLKSSEKIEWGLNYISVEEQKEIQQNAINRYKNIKDPKFVDWVSPEESKKAIESIIKQMEADLNRISEPLPIPVFSTIIKDSDDNLLFFEYPEEENANKFNVWIYGKTGKFVGQSSFVCDDYNLEINPSKMVFHNGYIYSLQLLKEAKGVPLRLVKFKITND
ncbi:MAG: hypothetical protein ACFCUM_17375 [Bacteroidales bacterium]